MMRETNCLCNVNKAFVKNGNSIYTLFKTSSKIPARISINAIKIFLDNLPCGAYDMDKRNEEAL